MDYYGYSIDKASSSLASPGNSRIVIPIQVFEGEFRSRPSIPSKCSFSRSLSKAKSNKVESASIKMNTSSIQVPQLEYSISITTYGNCATKNPSSICEGEYLALPSLALVILSKCFRNFISQVTSEHAISAGTAYSIQMPISALASRSPGVSTKSQLYCCVEISNNLSISAFEGDAQKQPRFNCVLNAIISCTDCRIEQLLSCRIIESNNAS